MVSMKQRPWPAWAKAFLSCVYFVVCVVLPVAGYVITEITERKNPGSPSPEAAETASFYLAILFITVVITATTLAWTLWGNAPRIVRYYTLSWSAIFVCVAGIMALLYGMVASSEPDAMTAFAILALVPPTFGMLAGTTIGVLPAVVMRIVLSGRSQAP